MDSGQSYELLYVDVRLLVSLWKSQYYRTAYPSTILHRRDSKILFIVIVVVVVVVIVIVVPSYAAK